jgi:hypothetical protein
VALLLAKGREGRDFFATKDELLQELQPSSGDIDQQAGSFVPEVGADLMGYGNILFKHSAQTSTNRICRDASLVSPGW